MIESEHNATSDNPPPASDAPRAISASLIALLFIAAAFVASNWFFYQQGERDAAVGDTATMPAAANDATTPPSDSVAQQADTNASTTMPATSDDTAQPAATDDMSKSSATEADAANGVAQNDTTTTMPATSDDSAQPAAPGDTANPSATVANAANTGAVAHQAAPTAKAKPAAKKRSLASVAKPSQPVVATPENRDVALLDRPNPAYPREALREHEQGTVLVLAQVDVQGHVSDARVIGHSGWLALDRAATNEVRNWQFQPALQDGKPVVASVQIPVSYKLEQSGTMGKPAVMRRSRDGSPRATCTARLKSMASDPIDSSSQRHWLQMPTTHRAGHAYCGARPQIDSAPCRP